MMPATRQRWRMFARLLAVSLGGYALASLAGMFVSAAMPWCCGWSRAEGVLTGSLLGFLFYLVAALWLFSVRNVLLASMVALVAIMLHYALVVTQ